MSAIGSKEGKGSQVKSIVIISGVLAAIGVSLFAYLMYYTAPAETMEMVKIIAVTESGCIAETLDGYSVNIGDCQAEPGQYVNALVDQKVKERAAMMNPTN
ncbi:MAG: hypothetical protein K5785_06130 [Nitrosarchaeum sp.]|nr:hypothetical protein [Nitrosarchaeum sp.]